MQLGVNQHAGRGETVERDAVRLALRIDVSGKSFRRAVRFGSGDFFFLCRMTGDKISMGRQARLFGKDLVFRIHWLKRIRQRTNGLGFAQEQKSSGLESVVERWQYFPLQVLFEIDEQITARDQVHPREGRITQKILPSEDDHLA